MKCFRSVLLAVLATAVWGNAASAETITVCADGCDYTSINAAINAASDGDVIQLSAETYFESAQVDTFGKAITLRGVIDKSGNPASVLDGATAHRVIVCQSGEAGETVFENLAIEHGAAFYGGGMAIFGGSPTLIDCVFSGNSGSEGGGLYISGGSPTLIDCMFSGNSGSEGGGLNVSGGSPTLIDCVFSGNSGSDGGGIHSSFSASATFSGCLFTGNVASQAGGGVSGSWNSLNDCVLCGNTSPQIRGEFEDMGGNCLLNVCQDGDGDGVLDCVGAGSELEVNVPADYQDIAMAIDAAAPGAVIHIAAGTYFPSSTLSTQGKPITLRGQVDSEGTPTTVVDGSGMLRVFECMAGEVDSTVFENIVFRNGLGKADLFFEDPVLIGGGMCIYDSSPVLRNCVFSESEAEYGAGLFLWSSNATLEGCVFEENVSTRYGGGGAVMLYSDVSMEACAFLANVSFGGGGGLKVLSSDTTLSDCVFSGNVASVSGGGIDVSDSDACLAGCAFVENSAGLDGGGIRFVGGEYGFPQERYELSISGCSFAGNSCGYQGGGICAAGVIGAWISECDYTLNRAGGDGAAVFIGDGGQWSVDMNGCVFTECCQVFPLGLGSAPELENDLGWPCVDCVGDVTCDALVNAADLGRLLSAWESEQQRYDLNEDGIVDAADLGLLLVSWGVCD